MRQKKRKTTEKEASAPSRFASLSGGEMQHILAERHSGKTKQMTNNGLFQPSKVILNFSVLSKIKVELSTENLK